MIAAKLTSAAPGVGRLSENVLPRSLFSEVKRIPAFKVRESEIAKSTSPKTAEEVCDCSPRS